MEKIIKDLIQQIELNEKQLYIDRKGTACDSNRYIFIHLMSLIEQDEQGVAFQLLDQHNIIQYFFPYIKGLKQVGKCKYHHVDAFTHMNAVYASYKKILTGDFSLPEAKVYIPKLNEKLGGFSIKEYLALAAFGHDIGKFICYKEKEGRITFSGHEAEGGKIMGEVCDKLSFPQEAKRWIVEVVRGHMYPLWIYTEQIRSYKECYEEFFEEYTEYVPYIIILSYCDAVAKQSYVSEKDKDRQFFFFLNKLLYDFKVYINRKDNSFRKG